MFFGTDVNNIYCFLLFTDKDERTWFCYFSNFIPVFAVNTNIDIHIQTELNLFYPE